MHKMPDGTMMKGAKHGTRKLAVVVAMASARKAVLVAVLGRVA